MKLASNDGVTQLPLILGIIPPPPPPGPSNPPPLPPLLDPPKEPAKGTESCELNINSLLKGDIVHLGIAVFVPLNPPVTPLLKTKATNVEGIPTALLSASQEEISKQ